MSELISVVLPIYKEPLEWIKKAVLSIVNQTYSSIEIIAVIDNPERTDVMEWLNDVNCRKIIVLKNDENVGIVESLNKGIAVANGNYIARMDADDVSESFRLEKQYKYLMDNECDLVATNTIKIDLFDNVIGESNLPQNDKEISNGLKKLQVLPHPTWLVKKEIYNRLNGYRKIDTAEDYDFLIRCKILGIKMGVVEERCLRYRQNLEGITQNNKGRQRVVSFIIREQLIKNRVFSLEEIDKEIKLSQAKIDQYTNYYRFTRHCRNVLFHKELISLKKLCSFRMYFFKIFVDEFVFDLF